MRNYKKRTKSTAAKSYNDYLAVRQDLENKGYVLDVKMNPIEFRIFYKDLRQNKVKNAWRVLINKEKVVSNAQAKNLIKVVKAHPDDFKSFLKDPSKVTARAFQKNEDLIKATKDFIYELDKEDLNFIISP